MRRDIGDRIPFRIERVLGLVYERACLEGRSLMLASAAARFSSLTAAQISWRYTGISAGASIPMRTVDPETSRTVMVTSSPRQIRSPDLRVMTSIDRLLDGCRRRGDGRHRL